MSLTLSNPAGAAVAAVATFESIGVTWPQSDGSSSDTATIRYRVSGGGVWKSGYPLWFDARDDEYRGSLVQLAPGTKYDIEVVRKSGPKELISVTTWPASFPIGATVTLPEKSSSTYKIETSGTAKAYRLYTAAAGATATIDVAGKSQNNLYVDASYVIIRGLTLRRAARHAVVLADGVHDVVIEGNDISGFGAIAEDGWGVNYDSGVYGHSIDHERIIIQGNYIHHPRSDSNNWSEYRANALKYHPAGPQAVTLFDSKGNHVIRYNTVDSDTDHRFNDCFGGGENYSKVGFPNRDSDIYGNSLSQCWDDGIESEGANRNVRIWGNYIDDTYVKIATATTSIGPLYIFRNIAGTSRQNDTQEWDLVPRGGFIKTSSSVGGGRIFVFHNTVLQPRPASGDTVPRGGAIGLGHGGDIMNMFSRNNILAVDKSHHSSIANGDSTSSFDFDLYNGELDGASSQERNGSHASPTYASADAYALKNGSPGFDEGISLPGFNDLFSGSKPDIGAVEAHSPNPLFGVEAFEPLDETPSAPERIDAPEERTPEAPEPEETNALHEVPTDLVSGGCAQHSADLFAALAITLVLACRRRARECIGALTVAAVAACGGSVGGQPGTPVLRGIPVSTHSTPPSAPTGEESPAEETPSADACSGDSTIWLIGDSTVAPKTGWGNAFGDREVTSNTTVNNRARGGESSKSFYESATSPWSVGASAVSASLRAGDYVLVQFGHNDEKSATDLHTEPGTSPSYDASYRSYLQIYVDEIRAVEAIPILITPVSRMVFDKGKLRRTHGLYPAAMRRLADDENITLLDLEELSFATFSALGEAETLEQYSEGGDLTHFPASKAWRVAGMMASLLEASASPLKCRLKSNVAADGR